MCRTGWKAAAAFLAAAALAGCAGLTTGGAPEQVVRQRAQERWDAMLAGDLTKAYAYMSPASREAISPELFRNSIRLGFWKAARVDTVKCDKEACEVMVQVTYQYRGSTVNTPVKETWVNSEGTWWHVFKPA